MARDDFNEERRGIATPLTSKEVMELREKKQLTTTEAAQYLNSIPKRRPIKAESLIAYRTSGRGPEYLWDPDSGGVRYEPAALDYYAQNICVKNNITFDLTDAMRVKPPKGVHK